MLRSENFQESYEFLEIYGLSTDGIIFFSSTQHREGTKSFRLIGLIKDNWSQFSTVFAVLFRAYKMYGYAEDSDFFSKGAVIRNEARR